MEKVEDIGHPVVSAEEMARVEAQSFEEGASGEAYMLKAGKSIAASVERIVSSLKRKPHITVFVGKGNNGGDACVAAKILHQKGFIVDVYFLFPLKTCRTLCQKHGKLFQDIGGNLAILDRLETLNLDSEGIILDGIFGTGFQGSVEGLVAQLIQKVNTSLIPVIAIDIPSGMNGTSGDVQNVAIRAQYTLYLGLPKMGFFLKEGYAYVGKLERVDFGMDQKYILKAQAEATLLKEKSLSSLLPPIQRIRHKYQAGYVLALAGSKGMVGAALLSSLAALRGGAGIVKLFYPKEMEHQLTHAPYELIRVPWDLHSYEDILQEDKRASAFLIGPGLGREQKVGDLLKKVVPRLTKPSVIDADALFFLKEHYPPQTVLTPHHQEMLRLLNLKEAPKEGLHSLCQNFSSGKNVILVLKGAPTWIFHPQKKPLIIPFGDPGMATAGTGDVLSGIIAAFLAQKLPSYAAAVLGVYLHARAGERGAAKKTSYSLIASDLIEEIPFVFKELI